MEQNDEIVEGTPLTREILTDLGFTWKLGELTAEEIEAHDDPFYWYKGPVKVYEVIDDFYVSESKVQTKEQLILMYEDISNRELTKEPTPEDTEPADLTTVKLVRAGMVKARMRGGPGDGKTFIYPKGLHFFIHQVKDATGSTHAHKYARKKGTKTIFEHQHEVF